MHIKGRSLSLLIPEEKIKERVKGLAKEIEKDLGENFVVVSLLKGSFRLYRRPHKGVFGACKGGFYVGLKLWFLSGIFG
jgi:hypothetical protein